MTHRHNQNETFIPWIRKYHIVGELVVPEYFWLIIIYLLHTHYCWRPYYHLLPFINDCAYFVRYLNLEVVWESVHLMMMHIWSCLYAIHISHHHYLTTLAQPRLVHEFKCGYTVGLIPYLETPISLISTHVQPSHLLHNKLIWWYSG